MLKSGAILLSALMILMIISAAGCAADTDPEKSPTGETTDGESAAEGLRSSLPDNLDYDGAVIGILHSSDPMFALTTDESSGEIVDDAILARNTLVQEQLNLSFEFISGDYDIAPDITNAVVSGSDDFRLISGMQWILSPIVLENYLANLADSQYLDIERPWWATEYIKEAGIGNNKRFFVTGDITLSMLHHMSCIYFNKSVYANMFGDPHEMYETVADGKWTFDTLGSMGRNCYADLNGNGTADDDDLYAYTLHTANLTDHLTYDAGLRVTERDEDGMPYLVLNNEKTINFTEKMYDLFYNNEGARVYPAHADTNNVVIPGKLKADELLFALGWFHTSELLRDMESDYGLIPYPKYDDTQQTYLSLVHDSALVYCIPVTCPKDSMEMICAVMEALAFESYRSVTSAYYEIALKVKYVRDSDDLALRIVDMIHAGATTDFAYLYNYALNGVGLFMRTLMGGKTSDFASYYASNEAAVTSKFDELIYLYTSLD
jgi:hypothetical protein